MKPALIFAIALAACSRSPRVFDEHVPAKPSLHKVLGIGEGIHIRPETPAEHEALSRGEWCLDLDARRWRPLEYCERRVRRAMHP